MKHSSMVHVRVDDETKTRAAAALAAIGLSVSDAVRLLLRRVANDQAFPLELKVPIAATQKGLAEAAVILGGRKARFATGAALLADIEKTGGK